MFSNESPGDTLVSFGMMPITPMPIALSAATSSTSRSMIALTNGQWLHMKTTSVPFSPRTSFRE
ncbi:hypothetical protein D3C83_60930 [compost metagenome]